MSNSYNNPELQASYRWCEEKTRNRAKNFYYAIRLLPKARREAMCAVYAFFRECDDISDAADIDNRRQRLERWKEIIKGASPDVPMPGLPALRHAVQKYRIDSQCFLDLIEGMIMDLEDREYRTFDETYLYCYRAASTVGLVCLSIFGFEPRPEVLKMAEYQGIAFQLTNILRDISKDAKDEKRVYLPNDILSRFNLNRQAVLDGTYSLADMERLIGFMASLTEQYYQKAEFLPYFINPQSRWCLRAMVNIYHGILKKIAKIGTESLKAKTRLSVWEKIAAVIRAYFRTWFEYWEGLWHDIINALKA